LMIAGKPPPVALAVLVVATPTAHRFSGPRLSQWGERPNPHY
jgi:hypothetical protein